MIENPQMSQDPQTPLKSDRGMVGSEPQGYALETQVVTPADRVRWGPIVAGLCSSLAIATLMTFLGTGLGIGLRDPGTELTTGQAWAIGLWSTLIGVLAFFFGGWMAARTVPFSSTNNGMLHGFMVWALALSLILLSMGIGSILGMEMRSPGAAGGVSGATNMIGPVSPAVPLPSGNTVNPTLSPGPQFRNPAMAGVSTDTISARRASWGSLIALIIGCGAAILGGLAGTTNPTETLTGYGSAMANRARGLGSNSPKA